MKLPEAFVEEMTQLIGAEDYLHFVSALEKVPQVAFRPNVHKNIHTATALKAVPWSSAGCYLQDRPAFTFDPLFHAGAYYVQEPSSMFVEQALNVCGEARRVLDLCASPGGKSTLLRSLLPPGSVLVCNEPLKLRAQVLLENMLKWGHPEVVVTNNYPSDFGSLKDFFDVIAIDAPCSGEGMFRKDNPALDEWSLQNVKACAQRQQDIVREVWPALREGGYMIYSTCTYNLEEDERNVKYFCETLGAEPVKIPVMEDWQVTGNLLPEHDFPVYRFMPHRTKGEGFFLALLRKNKQDDASASEGKPMKKTKKTNVKFLSFSQAPMKDWLRNSADFVMIEKDNTVFALEKSVVEVVNLMGNHFHILSAGIPVAVCKGNKFQPHQALALTTALHREAFTQVEIDREIALEYLRRMSLMLPANTPRGYVLLTFLGVPLGFVNNLGAHANNLYPQNWKIRSGYTPDDKFSFLDI
jgi:16S rRNA C967 or C1407 C5-methylase (RsmB/RsmF family)/NOL1/NOP2/fmu family ribosome biogenesis protein